MPIYEYQVSDVDKGCARCRPGFDLLQRISDDSLSQCPDCGSPIHRLISVPSVGGSKSSLDDRAKRAGFTKLKKLGKGEYERQY